MDAVRLDSVFLFGVCYISLLRGLGSSMHACYSHFHFHLALGVLCDVS